MRCALVLLPVGALLGACSAPSPDEAPDRGPTPSPAELRQESETRQRENQTDPSAVPASPASVEPPSAESPSVEGSEGPPPLVHSPGAAADRNPGSGTGALGAGPSPSPSLPPPPVRSPPPVAATVPAQLPSLPFTAYTTAPLSLDGVALQRMGVRVEVTAIEGEQARVLCSACPSPATGRAAVVPLSRLRAGRAPGGTGDVLDTVLMLRARWAGGTALPVGATNIEMCALVDHGFVLDAERATWSHGEGTVVLQWSGQVWDLAVDPTPPTAVTAWTCRAGGLLPSPPPRSSEEP